MMIKKYSGQLSIAGIDYSTIEQPEQEEITTQERLRRMEINSTKIFIQFPFDQNMVDSVKTLMGRKWHPESKSWTAPITLLNMRLAMDLAAEHEMNVGDKMLAKAEQLQREDDERVAMSKAETSDFEVKGLGGELFPFQKAGVEYIVKTRRCMLGDEMGLGKTVQALAAAQAMNCGKVVVVCPASLKLNWKRETEKWLPHYDVEILNGIKGHKLRRGMNHFPIVYVVNYDILAERATSKNSGWLRHLRECQPDMVIFDESHLVKNHQSARTKAAKSLAKGVYSVLMLTGTPILSRNQELVSQLGILRRLDDLGGFWPFVKRYCGAIQMEWGWDMSRSTHTDELNERMRGSFYIRREKSEVLPELPAKIRAEIHVDLSNRREYDKAEANLMSWIADNAIDDDWLESIEEFDPELQLESIQERKKEAVKTASRAEHLVRIEALKQIAARGKLKSAVEWISNFLESGEQLIVFATHKEIVNGIASAFNCRKIMGSTPQGQRDASVRRFQNGTDKLLAMNMKSGGLGLTLTAASNVLFLEMGWTPADHDQAEDRCHRIGQEDSVTAWYMIDPDSIDGDISMLIDQKRKITKSTTEGGTVEKTDIVYDLIKRLRERHE
jgi:SNF2 family DNA or RNA helicase